MLCGALGVAGLALAAGVADIDAVPHLSEVGRRDYARFLTTDHARAFAVAENGAWGYSARRQTRMQAVVHALYRCNKAARHVCRVYAVNEDVVYSRYATFEQRSRELIQALTPGRLGSTEYGDELRNFGVAPPTGLRQDDYHADTPLAVNGVPTITTVELVNWLTSLSPPILIDVLSDEGHKTIPGAYWIRGGGLYGRSEDASAEIRDRLRFILDGLTGTNRAAPIIFFCLESRCWLSYNAALRAHELGYTNVRWYRGGLKAWGAAGLELLEAVQYGQVS